MFKAVCYHPEECQVITGGTDRKIGYWDTFDGSQIRELDGSKTGSIDGMDITECGSYFVTGGSDKVVKVHFVVTGLVCLLLHVHVVLLCVTNIITHLRICMHTYYYIVLGLVVQ